MNLSQTLKQNPTTLVLFISVCAVITATIIQKRTSIEKNTLDFEEKYKHDETTVNNSKLTILACKQNKKDIEKIAKNRDKKKNKEIFNAINSTLNEWERAANAINHNLYDEEMLYKTYGSFIIYLWDNLREFVKIRQQIQPRYYINFTCLAII